MFDLKRLQGVLSQYSGAANPPAQNVHNDFDEAAQHAPPETLTDGISHALGSGQGAPFHQMVSQLFTHGNDQQRTGLLNKLLSAAGPSGLPAGLGSLSHLMGSGTPNVTPAQAQQVSPQAVEQLAQHVNSRNPSIVQEISGFVAQHPGWVKTLGTAALTLAMSRMAEHHRG